ncbi:MAG: hypothetical protein JWO38_134 [Gemmataceae bacterium]|nr:hypothetical protein [Gemmataceae bacterium]
MPRRPFPGLCALVVVLAAGQRAGADPTPAVPSLTPDQQKLLATMDADLAKDVVELAEQAQKWKTRLEAIRKRAELRAKAAQGLLDDDLKELKGLQAETPTQLLLEMAEVLKKRSPKVAQQVKFVEQLQAKIKEAEEAAKNARFDPKTYFDLDEEDFRAEVRDLALAAAGQALLKSVDKDLFGILDQLRHPAQFARAFVETELKKNYLNKPYPVGDVTFTLAQQDFTKSVFSADANLTLVVAYKAAGVELKAAGLYFRYAPGKLPEPVLDHVKVEATGVDALANKALKSLGDELPDIGLPIKITNPKVTDFDPKNGAKGGSLSFGVVVGLDDSLGFGSADLAKITAAVVVSAKGKVEVTGLGGTIKGQLPIGTTGLILDGGTIALKGKEKTVTIGTFICPATGGKEGISLDVALTFGFPIGKTGLAYKGALVLARKEVLGTIDGVITKEKVTGNFESAAGLPFRLKKCKFELNREALTASGTVEALYGAGNIVADLYEGFDGNGRFTVSEKFEIAKAVKTEASLAGSHTPGFKKIRLDGVLTVDVEAQPLGTFGAVVHITATNDPRPVVQGTATVGDVTVEFKAANFGGVYDALKAALLQKRDALYKYLADREKGARQYAADREKALDNWVYQNASKYGVDALRIDHGGPIDTMLGQKSQQLKNAGKQLADWRDTAGQDLAHVGHQAGKEAGNLAQGVSDFASNPVSTVSQVFGFRGLGLIGDTPAAQARGAPVRVGKVGGANAGFELAGLDVDQAIREHVKDVDKLVQDAASRARVTARLDKVLTGIENEHVHKARHARTGQASELRVRFDRATAHPDGAADAVITFAVQVNSFKHALDVHKTFAKPTTASDMHIGEIRLKGVYGAGRPKVEVSLPKLKNVSEWDADAVVRDHLTQLVHRLLGADVGGRFEERLLALHNATDEPLKVWVQFERHGKDGWGWLPDGHGPDKRAYSFTIPAKKTLSLRTPNGMVAGRTARVWAESESGRVWVRNHRTDLQLVDEKDETGATRYFADTMEHYVYTFTASDAPRTFRERVVAVKNASTVPALVHAAALSRDPDGKETWDATRPGGLLVEPGATVKIRQANGWLLRGSEAKVWAEAEKGQQPHWAQHRTAAVTQVGPKGYNSRSLGTYLYVLEPAGRPGGPAGPDATELRIPADAGGQPVPPPVKPPPMPPVKPPPPMPPVKPPPPVPPPVALVAVPNVTGVSLDVAKKRLEDAGLTFAVVVGRDQVPVERHEPLRKGWHVAKQSHPASEKPDVKKGTTITCTFERDPPKPVRRDNPSPE